MLFPAVAFSAWYCGVGPSIATVALATAGAKYWFITLTHSLRIQDTEQLSAVLAFLIASGALVAMGETRRRENGALQRVQGELEVRVRERTAELGTADQGLSELSARLLQLQDEERRRIARELHDSVGQMLAGLSMNISAVRRHRTLSYVFVGYDSGTSGRAVRCRHFLDCQSLTFVLPAGTEISVLRTRTSTPGRFRKARSRPTSLRT
jgi:hypothetical protein